MTRDRPWTYRPLGARLAAGTVSVALLAAVTVMWLALPGEIRATFTPLQRATLLLVLGCVLAVLYGIFRTAVRADRDGLTVVNLYHRRRFEWAAIVAVSLRRGQPWAVVDVADGTTVPAMAIQGADGERAVRAVRELSALLAERTPTERND